MYKNKLNKLENFSTKVVNNFLNKYDNFQPIIGDPSS
jgi:hypothetical protein